MSGWKGWVEVVYCVFRGVAALTSPKQLDLGNDLPCLFPAQ